MLNDFKTEILLLYKFMFCEELFNITLTVCTHVKNLPLLISYPPQWPLYFKIQYNKQIWYDAYYVRNSKTEQINFARERQAAVQPTINAARKMFAPSQTVRLMNIYLCMHTQSGGIYLPSPPPKHTHTHVYTTSIA